MTPITRRPTLFRFLGLNACSFAVVACLGLFAALTTSTTNPSAALWPTQALAIGMVLALGLWSVPGSLLGALPAALYQTGTPSGVASVAVGFAINVLSAIALLHFARVKNLHHGLGEYFLPLLLIFWITVCQVLGTLPVVGLLAWTGNLHPSFYYERMFSWIFAGGLGYLFLFPFFVAQKHTLRRLASCHPLSKRARPFASLARVVAAVLVGAAILALGAWRPLGALVVFPVLFFTYGHFGARTLATGTFVFGLLFMAFDATGVPVLNLPDAAEARVLKQFFLLTVGALASLLPLIFRGPEGRQSALVLALISTLTWPLFVVFHLFELERTSERFFWYASLAEQEVTFSAEVDPKGLLGRHDFLHLVPSPSSPARPSPFVSIAPILEPKRLVRRIEVPVPRGKLASGVYDIVPGQAFHGEQPHRSLWSGFSSAFLLFALGGVFANRTQARARAERLADRRLRELERHRALSLEQARLVSLGEMAGSIAHEINNPLAIICGRSQQLLAQFASDAKIDFAEASRQMSSIDRTAHRIARIVEGLRRFSRNAENAPLERESLLGLVEQVLELTREKFLRSGIEVQILIPSSISVCCRGVQIGQVFHNLLSNGYDALAVQPDIAPGDAPIGWVRVIVVPFVKTGKWVFSLSLRPASFC